MNAYKLAKTLTNLRMFDEEVLEDFLCELDSTCEQFMISLDRLNITESENGPKFIEHDRVLELHVGKLP